ncbi:uncharacterized protein [Clytia hemisphaerica]|uniref:Uncharacterized protein n=1 Tax=Clytia hemisphaerica TaxID=252671 RepID=A0A7M5X5Y0_9CNID
MNDEYDVMEEIEFSESYARKKQRAKETGYTGMTLLASLYDVYSFNPFTDMVRDVMHCVLLNCCKKLFTRYFKNPEFDMAKLQENVDNFPFTSGMLDGHCPKKLAKYNSWTAEEWQKFTFPMAEVVFIDLVSDDELHLVWLTARMVELLFHRRDALSEEEVQHLENICWRRLILLEEQVDPKQCVITAHNSIHIAEDILKFGPSDNFWCFQNERAVKRYKDLPTNFKNIECTFSKAELRRELLMTLKPKGQKFAFKLIDEVNMISSSLDGAKAIAWNTRLAGRSVSDLVVFIGASSLDTVHLSDDMLRRRVEADGLGPGDIYQSFRSCYFAGSRKHVKSGSCLLFNDGSIGMVKELIFVKHSTGSSKYIRLEKFERDNDGLLIQGFQIYSHDATVFIGSLLDVIREVIMYPYDDDQFICIDVNRGHFNFGFPVLP